MSPVLRSVGYLGKGLVTLLRSPTAVFLLLFGTVSVTAEF